MTLTWIETNGQASVLMSRSGVPAALATVEASAQGIDQIMWFMWPVSSRLFGSLGSFSELAFWLLFWGGGFVVFCWGF